MINNWGYYIWIFLHNFANKIDNDYFCKNKNFVIDTIKLICISLPCYLCSDHAKLKFNNYNFNTIKEKNDLKKFLFDFHNHINKKLNKQVYDLSVLNKYDNCDFNISCNNYFKIIDINNDNNNNSKLMLHKFHNKNNLNNIKSNIKKIFYN